MKGKVYLVGIGPGNPEDITLRAVGTLKKATVVIGQKSCLEQIPSLLEGKRLITAALTPVERSRIAIDHALAGQVVAVVTPGDPGTYAIASTFFGYLVEKEIRMPVEVVPGVTAASAAAALLGSPLGGDTAAISLADMAVPWSIIKKRIVAAGGSGFVIILYNPRGKAGKKRLQDAFSILKNYRAATTPVGIVTKATSASQKIRLTTLAHVARCHVGAETLLIIGNGDTLVHHGRMVTPRAYREGIGY